VTPHDSIRSGAASSGEQSPSAGSDGLGRSRSPGTVTRLIDEFAAAWGRGERPPAEAFLEHHPRLTVQPEAAIRLIYEEVCLRQGEGQTVALAELLLRFPQWRSELEVLLECDRLVGTMAAQPVFPAVGETLGEFHLLAELGRGARGRCFLAVQPALADRHVVVKVTTDDHGEHLSLARLQHTHIMPLYSEHQFPERKMRALCMPYLGGATLAQILARLRTVPADQLCGQLLLDVLDRTEQIRPWPQSRASPARLFLAQASFVRAVCWIGACVADALQYAHGRGLVHMDVKPSNILLTADAQPMLLDFHLARGPIGMGKSAMGRVGGTPGYMSPEQDVRVSATGVGPADRPAVDARSDLYSLGRVLADLLGADHRAAAGAGAPRVVGFMPGVSTGLADVIRKCLATDPNDRYPDAATLGEDLRRHMADQPLRGVPNRSLKERFGKWCRRQPYEFFQVKTLFLASLAALSVALVVWIGFLAPRFRAADQALREGRVLLSRRDYSQAERELTRGVAFIQGLPGSGRLLRELAAALRLTDRMEEADRLHRLVDRLRFSESAAELPVASAGEVERHCRALWESRHRLLERPEALGPQLEQRLRDDLLDLAVIGSNLRVRLEADPKKLGAAHRAALALLEEAEASFGPSHVLYRARQAHAEAIGLASVAAAAARGALRVPPRTAWEHDAAGRVLLASGDFEQAEAAFEQAITLEPQDLWPNFHLGVCNFRLGRYHEAVNAFRVCVALAPDRAECYYNRARAQAALGHSADASRDFDRAVALDPALAAAPLERRAHRAATGPPPPGTP
jgi:eukaryotic-like serine/threonine-protein kinase